MKGQRKAVKDKSFPAPIVRARREHTVRQHGQARHALLVPREIRRRHPDLQVQGAGAAEMIVVCLKHVGIMQQRGTRLRDGAALEYSADSSALQSARRACFWRKYVWALAGELGGLTQLTEVVSPVSGGSPITSTYVPAISGAI